MNSFDRIMQMIVRITGVFQVLLGIAFWTGHGLTLIPLHMAVGTLFVLSLWILAVRAGLSGAGWGLAGATIAWGAGAIAFGMVQAQILPGAPHWVIRVLHLLVGMVAMGLAARLGLRIQRSRIGRPAVLGARPA
jgi:hypothetical protein